MGCQNIGSAAQSPSFKLQVKNAENVVFVLNAAELFSSKILRFFLTLKVRI